MRIAMKATAPTTMPAMAPLLSFDDEELEGSDDVLSLPSAGIGSPGTS